MFYAAGVARPRPETTTMLKPEDHIYKLTELAASKCSTDGVIVA
jgi:hypothetical protein